MKETQEDYVQHVQPIVYEDSQGSKDQLITKFQLRIQKDLNQINGVYDSQIAEAEEVKKKHIMKLEAEYKNAVEMINNKRNNDILVYNEKAVNIIDNLITSMNNYEKKPIESWWSKIFG